MTVHITKGSGKMQGILSINTSTLQNKFCSKMSQKEGSVCSRCYAAKFSKLRPSIDKAFLKNDFLKKRKLEQWEIPYFPTQKYVRFHSYGELKTVLQLQNFILICNGNLRFGTVFVLFTKRKDIVKKVFSRIEKPENLILIQSSLHLDKIEKKAEYFDKVFTVFSKEKVLIQGTETALCHGRACQECLVCYDKDNGKIQINEKLK